MKRTVNLMLDSGAFSVWTRGKTVELDRYIEFCLEHRDLLTSYVNLDVMPGQPGAQRTQEDVEYAASQGWRNLMRMRRFGLEPIHVFHQGERRYWLEKMLGEGLQYIGLSPNIKLPTKQRKEWLDEQFHYLCGEGGYPPVRVHGFGMTAVSLIHRYPWYTTDSSTWVLGSKTGACLIPHAYPGEKEEAGKTRRYDFSRKAFNVKFAETKWGQADVDVETGAQHFLTLGRGMRNYVVKYLEGEGFDVERVRQEYGYRCQVNAHFFKRVQIGHPNAPFLPRHCGFFRGDHCGKGADKARWTYRIVLVNATSREFCTALEAESMPNHLQSYMDMKNRTDVEQYIRTGFFTVKSPTSKRKSKKLKGMLT